MYRLQCGVCVAALGLLAGTARADEPKKAPDPAEALIDKLVDVAEPDTGYSGSVSGTSFLPLGRREVGTVLLFQRPGAPSDTVRSLVKLGVKAGPALLDHLSDNRLTKIVVEAGGVPGKLEWTRLHAAVELGVPEFIEAALKEARDVNARDRDGRTALHLAAAVGRCGAVEQLLSAKADPNVKDKQGHTPLDLAKARKHAAVIKLLEDPK